MLTVLDLFSGIGGFSLGLERTGGFKTAAFCEIEPYCQAVLRKHWPDVPIFEDVTKLGASDVGPIDVICGGFPCQDISAAGKQAGIDGNRSGLWSEFARLIGEIRPRFAIVENVSALLHNGMGRVLGDLAAIGYDAEWHCIPASAVGAPHRRDRVWIVAYAAGERRGEAGRDCQRSQEQIASGCEALADPSGASQSKMLQQGRRVSIQFGGICRDAGGQWLTEPDVGRVANGIPRRVDRLRALGNAVVPAVVEVIGNAILESEYASSADLARRQESARPQMDDGATPPEEIGAE